MASQEQYHNYFANLLRSEWENRRYGIAAVDFDRGFAKLYNIHKDYVTDYRHKIGLKVENKKLPSKNDLLNAWQERDVFVSKNSFYEFVSKKFNVSTTTIKRMYTRLGLVGRK